VFSVYGVQLNHENKTKDFLFFVFQNVSRTNEVNTVNMNAPPLPGSNLDRELATGRWLSRFVVSADGM
jgi:hypothetical protein